MDWPEVTKYRALVSAQAHREEIIQDLYNRKESPKGVVHGGMIRFCCQLLILFFFSIFFLYSNNILLRTSLCPLILALVYLTFHTQYSLFCREHLVSFYKTTKLKPHRIIFYRLTWNVHSLRHLLLIQCHVILKCSESDVTGCFIVGMVSVKGSSVRSFFMKWRQLERYTAFCLFFLYPWHSINPLMLVESINFFQDFPYKLIFCFV